MCNFKIVDQTLIAFNIKSFGAKEVWQWNGVQENKITLRQKRTISKRHEEMELNEVVS